MFPNSTELALFGGIAIIISATSDSSGMPFSMSFLPTQSPPASTRPRPRSRARMPGGPIQQTNGATNSTKTEKTAPLELRGHSVGARCVQVRPPGENRIREYIKRNMRAIRINTAVGKQKNKSQTTLNNGSDKPSDRCVRSFNR